MVSAFPFQVALLYGFTLVVELLTSADAKLHLYESVLQVHLDRYQGEAFLLHLLPKLSDLFLVNQELALPLRLVVVQVPEGVGRDVEADEVELSFLDPGAVLETHLKDLA